MQKALLRQEYRQIRHQLPPDGKAAADRAIARSFSSLSEYVAAENVLFYVSLPDEVDTNGLIKDALSEGRQVLVPFMEGGDISCSTISSLGELVPARHGVLEPKSPVPFDGEVGLVVVPGLAFTKAGARLGFGKGCYDRFLATLPGVRKVALAYEAQMVDSLPLENHDVLVDIVVTEKQVFRCDEWRR